MVALRQRLERLESDQGEYTIVRACHRCGKLRIGADVNERCEDHQPPPPPGPGDITIAWQGSLPSHPDAPAIAT